ncbi:fibronectin type III domain-containing protein [Streptomyces litchfieldiae]|uniref:Fibronectin type III domain-containing protein n=1 Tax=Streptomyces litchfieldiae TaxID=3075543 RepID=A0ABU2MPS3_9ACTN|nr:fibronectin type III domain-containing protein [Streptomyces sp. DSM 44938]MDT0343471.1 fibronectin type III domain-containing protein [Streptomyces sp. DSM 44938]
MAPGPSRRSLLQISAAGTATTLLALNSAGPAAARGSTAAAAAPGAAAARPDVLDGVVFGDAASEEAHALAAEGTQLVDGPAGGRARTALPLATPGDRGADLRFVLAVDPAEQNHLTLKFWGEDDSEYKTVLFVNGEQASYRGAADYEPINAGTRGGLPGRYFFATALLPLASTQGQSEVEIIVRTYASSPTGTVTAASRRYLEAFTHTSPWLEPGEGDTTDYAPGDAAAPALTPDEERALVERYQQRQIDTFNALSQRLDADPSATMSIVRYRDELRFYAEALLVDWCPARSAADQRVALGRLFTSIDNFTRQYYGNVKSLGNGGHQSDWGGYYSELGEALYIVENLIADEEVYGRERFAAFLAEPFETGTTDGENSMAGVGWQGEELTRFSAWERVLKATFDFARSRLSYIYNQVMYTYEGAWKAHEGLRVIGSRFYEGRARGHAIAGEALGWLPFLGEEVLVGPDGRELDLYHSLFKHDRNAVYTDDYLRIVMRGLARSKLDENGEIVRRLPYGRHYTGITKAGLTRENGYVGNYGEATNYLPSWFHRTWGHAGDEELNDNILRLALRSIHARGQTRYQSVDADNRRVMRMQQVIDDRNTAYPGRMAYGTDEQSGAQGMGFASLEHHMARHPERYRGRDWEPYWEYAREAVGFLQQQLVDNRYFSTFDARILPNHRYTLRFKETWEYITGGRAGFERFGRTAAGVVLPHTDLRLYTDEELARLGVARGSDRERFAWVDIDNLLFCARDGDTHLFAALLERNKGGFLGNGRVHAQRPGLDQLAQLATEGVLRYREYTLRAPSVEEAIFHDRYTPAGARPSALAGELAPVSFQPGVGRTDRDNFREDTPYAGYPELATTRFGPYFFAVNTTRAAYRNQRTHQAVLPPGTPDGSLPDLVSGQNVRVRDGRISLAPETAVLLKLDAPATVGAPALVDVVVATPGSRAVGLTWRPAAGAVSYTVTRAEGEHGTPRTVAEGVSGTTFLDRVPFGDATYSYRVRAVNGRGRGRESTPVTAVVTPARARRLRDGDWRDDAVGEGAAGSAAVGGGTVTVSGVAGAGLAGGDDDHIYDRDHRDSLYLVSRLAEGGVAVTARLGGPAGDLNGVMLRDGTGGWDRYVYLGADASGLLSFRTRSLDSREDIGTGTAGQNADGGITRSPMTVDLGENREFGIAGTPWVRLVRHADSHLVTALVSADGDRWERIAASVTPMAGVLHAGVAATADARFADVAVERVAAGVALAAVSAAERGVTVHWNKPKAAVAFSLHRTTDAAALDADPRESDAWERLTDREYATSYADETAPAGAHYRVLAHFADGTARLP